MSRRIRAVLVLTLALGLMAAAGPAAPASQATDVEPQFISYVSGNVYCPTHDFMEVVSHASGTVHHRIDGLTVGVYYNGSSFMHDSSTGPVSQGFWEVESVGGYIFKANGRCV